MKPTDAPGADTARASGVVWYVIGPPLFREDPLQDLIESRPALLPFVDEGPVAVAAELKVPKDGRADVVVIDAEGRITIVETKLGTNGDFRGVLGQILSYAGGLHGLDYDLFEERFAAARRTTGLTAPFEASSGAWKEEPFRGAVDEHLKAGAFHLIIAVDVVTEALAQTVEFVDAQMPEYLRLSVLVCGTSAVPVRRVPRPADKTPEDLVAGIRTRNASAGEAADAILGWIRSRGLEMNCQNGKDGIVENPGGETLFRIVGHEEMVRVSLRGLRTGGLSEETIAQLVEELDTLGFRANVRHSRVSLAVLAETNRVREFTALMEGVLEELPG